MRFSAIGDCVMAGYAVNDLRAAYPTANIHWVVDERCAAVVGKTSESHRLPRSQWKKRGEIRTLFEQFRWHSSLRKYSFDYGFDLQGHSKTAWCLRLSGAKKRLSVRATDVVARLLNPVYGNQPASEHDVDWSRQAIHSLLPSKRLTSDFLPGEPQQTEAKLVTICTGAGHVLKHIPVDKLEEIASKLVQNGNRVVALGGPNDPQLGAQGVENLIGRTSLHETIDWIRKSETHVAGDTGTGHIAAAVGTRLVTVWGNMPLEKYRPYTENVTILNRGGKPSEVQTEEIFRAVMGESVCVS